MDGWMDSWIKGVTGTIMKVVNMLNVVVRISYIRWPIPCLKPRLTFRHIKQKQHQLVIPSTAAALDTRGVDVQCDARGVDVRRDAQLVLHGEVGQHAVPTHRTQHHSQQIDVGAQRLARALKLKSRCHPEKQSGGHHWNKCENIDQFFSARFLSVPSW